MRNVSNMSMDQMITRNKKALFVLGRRRKNSGRVGTGVLHLLLLPSVVLLLVYSYMPMVGLIIAFKDFQLGKGFAAIFTAKWVGLDHFKRIFSNEDAASAIFNTVNISFWKIVAMFVVPLVIAILLNEVRKSYIKRSIQTLIYLPYFLSWIILAGIIKDVFGMDGILNTIMAQLFNMDPVIWLGQKELFPGIIVITHVWKEFGFSTIIFLAAITSINPSLYESAVVDGATRWKQTWHITLPGMRPIIVLCLVLSLGGILNAGFEQIFNLYSVPVYDTGDIIDTLIYRISFMSGQYDIGTAIGLFKSVVSGVLVSMSYYLAYKLANYEIF